MELKLGLDILIQDWFSVSAVLMRLQLSIPHPPDAARLWSVFPFAQSLSETLARSEQPYRAQIERTIEELCTFGRAHCDDPTTTYYIALRCESAAWFLQGFQTATSAGQASIIPFPALEPIQVIRWLLGPWWASHGTNAMCRQRICDSVLAIFAPPLETAGRVS